jgi:hypothetical protein
LEAYLKKGERRNMKLTKKQTIAIDTLEDNKTEFIIFGGG